MKLGLDPVNQRGAGWSVDRMLALLRRGWSSPVSTEGWGLLGCVVVGDAAPSHPALPGEQVHLPGQSHQLQVEQPSFPV